MLAQAAFAVHADLFGIKLGGDTTGEGELYGTLAVVEPQDVVISPLLHYGLQSPAGLIRTIVQQSNCFVLVERARAMQNLIQERYLAAVAGLAAAGPAGWALTPRRREAT